ncbi:MAG: hypothetical protein LBU08_02465 [Tannerellaceae bacterium]|jgi:hypothetical protein|nr:hypothetical protein [Tannerellaceae bacterium]
MKKSEKDYWERFFGDLAKASFIVVCLAGLALMFTSPERVFDYAMMTSFGALLTFSLGLLGSLFANMDSYD